MIICILFFFISLILFICFLSSYLLVYLFVSLSYLQFLSFILISIGLASTTGISQCYLRVVEVLSILISKLLSKNRAGGKQLNEMSAITY